jgi:hypothetical protein
MNQLKKGGLMVFSVVSDQADMFGQGKYISRNRYEVMPGVKVYFYNDEAIVKEFGSFGLQEYKDLDEPIKHVEGYAPLKVKYVVCRKVE